MKTREVALFKFDYYFIGIKFFSEIPFCNIFKANCFSCLLVSTEVSVEVCGHSDAGTVYERIRLEKLPYIHRAVTVTMDSKGRNFGILQSDPKAK